MEPRRYKWLFILAGIGLLALVLYLRFNEGPLSSSVPVAKRITFRNQTFDWYKINPAENRLQLFWKDQTGKPYGNFAALRDSLRHDTLELIFATNAGIFSSDFTPGGLHIEDGKEFRGVNLKDGEGNFHLKPNGVFFIEKGKAVVMESGAFSTSSHHPDYATQSGPMLVLNDALHPEFTEGSSNTNVRNGVGVDAEGFVHFAISNGNVNFYDFALLFREVLKCPNALYLDGSISDMYVPALERTSSGGVYCGIWGVVQKTP